MAKLLVSDFDNTFYLNDKDIEDNIINVNDFMEKGNLFVVATGRSFLDFCKQKEKFNFKYDYALLNHGSLIIDKNDKILLNMTIDNNVVKNIVKDLDVDESVSYFCCSGLDSRVLFSHKNLNKINIQYKNKETALSKELLINQKYGDCVKAYFIEDNSIEIISSNISKSISIYKLMSFIGDFDKKDIYVIGDSYNDIEMVKEFNGYAMTNSIDELKKVAQKLYNSVSDLIKEL